MSVRYIAIVVIFEQINELSATQRLLLQRRRELKDEGQGNVIIVFNRDLQISPN